MNKQKIPSIYCMLDNLIYQGHIAIMNDHKASEIMTQNQQIWRKMNEIFLKNV